jgi:hypothetical protein
MKTNGIEYDRINKFVGRWNTEGRILPTATSPEIKISGTDSYEWLPGEFFLLHKVNVLVGDDKNQTLEIIGFDSAKNQYTMQHYDNKGNSGFMTGYFADGRWTFLGETLRFTGGFSSNDTVFSGVWEKSDDGKTWTHFMDIRLVQS